LIGGEIAFVGVWSGWSEVAPLKALAASMTCRITGLTTCLYVFVYGFRSLSKALCRHPWFNEYHKSDADGSVMDPYKTLPTLPLGGDEENEVVVREGTAAIRID